MATSPKAAILRRRARIAKAQGKLRSKARTPRQPRADELALNKILIALAEEINALIRKALAGDLRTALSRERADADLEDIFESRLFEDLEVRVLRLVRRASVGASVDKVAERLDERNAADAKRVIGISPDVAAGSRRAELHRLRRVTVGLVEGMAKDQLAALEALVTEAANTGMRAETLSRKMEERLDVTPVRASLIATDQILTTNSALSQLRQQAVGVEEYEWSTSGDSRVREKHAALDGEIFRYDAPPITNRQGERNHPGGDYRCRCAALPILPE